MKGNVSKSKKILASDIAKLRDSISNVEAFGKEYTDEKIAELIGSAPEMLDTLEELADALKNDADIVDVLNEAIANKASGAELEEHTSDTTTHITSTERANWNAKADGKNAYDGFEGGNGASATHGGAVGYNANATSGGAVGSNAKETSGGFAGGVGASTFTGGAVGVGASSSNGFAGGFEAIAEDNIQLGQGTNSTYKTLQVYDYQLMDAGGNIPAERLNNVTKAQVGLGNVDNTSDLNKPISTATKKALDELEAMIENSGGDGSQTTDGGFIGGEDASATSGGAIGCYANSTSGGAVGNSAKAIDGGAIGGGTETEQGGAVGHYASSVSGFAGGEDASTNNGGAIGQNSNATDGGAVGYEAVTETGGAVGDSSSSTTGGAVGQGAKTTIGFAGGYNAKTLYYPDEYEDYEELIDAIQLGTGTNSESKTLQVYNYQLMGADGNIPSERLNNVTKTQVGLGNVTNDKQATEKEFNLRTDIYEVDISKVGADNNILYVTVPNITAFSDLDGKVINVYTGIYSNNKTQTVWLNVNGYGAKPIRRVVLDDRFEISTYNAYEINRSTVMQLYIDGNYVHWINPVNNFANIKKNPNDTTGDIISTHLTVGTKGTGTIGDKSLSSGSGATASGDYSVALGGTNNTASAAYSGVLGGFRNKATSDAAVVFGGYDNTAGNASSGILGGATNTVNSLQSGIVGGNTNTIDESCEHSAIIGGKNNTIEFYDTDKFPVRSAIIAGQNNIITNYGANSVIIGGQDNMIGDSINASIIAGYYAIADNYNTVLGRYNVVPTAGAYTGTTGDAFVVGIGTSSARKNGFRVAYNGNCYAATAMNSTGADYAECFEWVDGNPENEDRVGLMTAFDGTKIRLANADDPIEIIGIVSAIPAVVGDNYADEWCGKYQKDKYGRMITEHKVYAEVLDDEGNVIKSAYEADEYVLNPDYNPDEKYIPRLERPEYDAVGTHGKLVVRDDGSCKVGGFCRSGENGIATASENGFYVMERIDDETIRVYIK